jgi:lauroyl/myristoyl acyltransferase
MTSWKARLIPAATFLIRFIPRSAAIVIAHAAADVWAVIDRRRRRAIDRNLRRTAPANTPSERRRLTRATFRNFAAVWVDFLRVPLLSRRAVVDLVRWNTRVNLDAALARGRGVLIVAAHEGAVDLAGICLAAHGYRISVVVDSLDCRMKTRSELQRTEKVENVLLLAVPKRIEVLDHDVRFGGVEGEDTAAAMRPDRLLQVRRSSIVQEE